MVTIPRGLLDQPSTADVMAGYQEPNPLRDKILGLLSPAMHFTLDQILRDRRLTQDPIGETGNRLKAAGAGAASVPDDIAGIFGQRLYGPETRGLLDEAMAGDPQAAFGGAVMTPIPAGSVARGIAAAPRASTAGLAGAGLMAGAAEAGDSDYDSKRSALMQQQQEAFQTMESKRRELDAIADKRRAEIESLPIVEQQRLVNATQDGIKKPGGETERKINAYIDREVDKAKRDAQDRLNSLQARYDTLKGDIDRLDAEESPAAIRERQKNSRLAELNPAAAYAAQFGPAVLGLGLDMLSKGRGRAGRNAAIMDANTAARTSATNAEKLAAKGDVYGASKQAAAADAAQQSSSKASREPWWGDFIPGYTVAGVEAGQFMPDAIDYMRANANNSKELHESVMEGVWGDPETRNYPYEPVVERLGMTVPLAMALQKIGKGGASVGVDYFTGRQAPVDISHQTRPIKDQAGGLLSQRAQGMADDITTGIDANRRAQAAMQQPPPPAGLMGPPPPQTPQGGLLTPPASGPAGPGGVQPTPSQAVQPTPSSSQMPTPGASSTGSGRSSQVPRARKNEILDELASGNQVQPANAYEQRYIDNINTQARDLAFRLGVPYESALSAMSQMIKSGTRKTPFAIAGAAPMGLLDDEGF